LLREPLLLGVAATTCVTALASVVWLYSRRLTPAEREKRRRLAVNFNRRTVEGFVTDASAEAIQYTYEFRGVEYYAAQDVSALTAWLPPAPERIIGPVSIKYDPRNPINSIVLCEEWSGIPEKKVEARA
jgi:hypothetical protein